MAEFKKHNEYCKSIVENLKAYRSGNYFEYDGNLYPIDPNDEFWNKGDTFCYYLDDDGYYYFDIDGEKIEESDVEAISLYDYLTDIEIYDINYILDSNKKLEAVRLMVACGGPNIYINTWDKQVELYWWSESGKAYLPNDLCEAINEYFAENFNY